MSRLLRRRRSGAPASIGRPRVVDDQGNPVTFAAPGDPTPEERRRYAQALDRASTPPPVPPAVQAEAAAAHARRRELFPHLYND